MEYEIYFLCNVLGLIVIFLVIMFHFIDADNENSQSLEQEHPEVAPKEAEPVVVNKKEKGKKSH